MPVIVAPEQAPRWLDPSVRDIEDLLQPFASNAMTAYPVSRLVNAVRNDGPELVQPIE